MGQKNEAENREQDGAGEREIQKHLEVNLIRKAKELTYVHSGGQWAIG